MTDIPNDTIPMDIADRLLAILKFENPHLLRIADIAEAANEIKRLRADRAEPDTTPMCIDPKAIERLKRWREVGDGPISYTAGSKQFADDVIVLLVEVDRLRADRAQTE